MPIKHTLVEGTVKHFITPKLSTDQIKQQFGKYQGYGYQQWKEKYANITSTKNNITLDKKQYTRVDLQHFTTGYPQKQGFDMKCNQRIFAHFSLQTNGEGSITIANLFIDRKMFETKSQEELWGVLRKTFMQWITTKSFDALTQNFEKRYYKNYCLVCDD